MTNDQDVIDETRDIDNSEDGNFPATRLMYDRRAHAHYMVTGHNAPTEECSRVSYNPNSNSINPLPQQFNQPQNITTHISSNKTLPMVERTPQRQNLDPKNTINNLVEAVPGIASQQQPQTSSVLLKPTMTNKLIIECKNEIIELFADFFKTMIRMQPEMSEAMKVHHFQSHLQKDAPQTFRNINAGNKRRLEDLLIILRQKYVRPQSEAAAKHKSHKLNFDANTKSLFF